MNSDIFVSLSKNKKEIEDKGILKRIFNVSVKLSVWSLVAIGAFLTPHSFHQSELNVIEHGKIPDLSEISPLTTLLILIIIALLILYFTKKKG